MEFTEAIRKRESIREYQDKPVSPEKLSKVLEAARLAPSASNRQPWTFIVDQDEALRQQIGQHAAYYFVRWAHVAEAPMIIVLCGDTGKRLYRQYLHEDIGLAGSQIMLQAKALGLGTCWVGGVDAAGRKQIATILKLPEHLEVVGLLTVGFPAEDPPPPARKPLTEIVHYDVYGNQAPGSSATPGRARGGALSILLRRLRLPLRV